VPNPPQEPPIASTAPNFTTRDDRTPVHQQVLESTSLPATKPRALGDREAPEVTDLVGPSVPTDWFGVPL
jgi:hypothetical protein